MLVRFRTTKLQKAFEQGRRADRLFGQDVARKYTQRVKALQAAETFAAIQAIRAFRAHPLKESRKGEWAIDLTGQMRLIVIPHRDGKTVSVEEVSAHYGD